MGESQLPMRREVYRAAVTGDCSIFEHSSLNPQEDFVTRIPVTNDNIIHIAIQHESYDFVGESLRRFPQLVCQSNTCNETPFHVAAQIGSVEILSQLLAAVEQGEAGPVSEPPWRERNSEGNTPLHVALIYGKVVFAVTLMNKYPELACIVNNSKETPLHLAIKHRNTFYDKEEAIEAAKLVAKLPGATFMVRCPLPEAETEIDEESTAEEERHLNLEPLIKLLLQKNVGAACTRDASGLTPLLRAASVNRLPTLAIHTILHYSPQSAKVYDHSGSSFLHLLDEIPWSEDRDALVSIPEIRALKNHQDAKGNTPAHVAIQNRNVFLIQLLMRMSADFTIRNREGISAAFLIKQHVDEFRELFTAKKKQLSIPCKSYPQDRSRLRDILLRLTERVDPQEAARLRCPWEPEICSGIVVLAHGRGNLLHEIIEYKRDIFQRYDNVLTEFIREALSCDHYLFSVYETDDDGCNPLHAIAKWVPEAINGSLLRMLNQFWHKVASASQNRELGYQIYGPLTAYKNALGNTPPHEGILGFAEREVTIASVVKCVIEFFRFTCYTALFQNDNMETPLHLLSQVNKLSDADIASIMDALPRQTAMKALALRDKDGFTPVLKAAQKNNFRFIKTLYTLGLVIHDDCTLIPKENGRRLWHLVADKAEEEFKYPINSDLDELLTGIYRHSPGEDLISMLHCPDNDGNTPLHLAIMKRNFGFAELLLNHFDYVCDKIKNSEKVPDDYAHILSTRNKKRENPADVIGVAENVPRQFEEVLWSRTHFAKKMMGVRSISGIPGHLMKDYVNTIGVIAALLATITFTAAFTVPGGLNTGNGAPLLMKELAFQVFMVSDIIAMCLSMMILFCLLWIMGSEPERVVLLDLVIILLKLSFTATLLAFMTGLYVTTFPVAPWMAILACVLCSLLALLMREHVIIYVTNPLIILFIFIRQVALRPWESLCMACKTLETYNGPRPSQGHEVTQYTTGIGAAPHEQIATNEQENDQNTGHHNAPLEPISPSQQEHEQPPGSSLVIIGPGNSSGSSETIKFIPAPLLTPELAEEVLHMIYIAENEPGN